MGGNDAPELGLLAKSGPETVGAFTISNMLDAPSGQPIRMFFAGIQEEQSSLNLVSNVTGKGRGEDEVATHLDPTGGHSWTVWFSQLAVALPWWFNGTNAREQAGVGEHSDAGAQSGADADSRATEDAARAEAEAAAYEVAHPALFSLRGWGTIGSWWVGALMLAVLSLWAGPRILFATPASGRHARSASTRGGAIGAFVVRYALVVVTALVMSIALLLVVNRGQSFYTNAADLISDLRIFF